MVIKKFAFKEKSTFSFSAKVKDDLEDSWMKLRRMLKGHGISKSIIVEEAVKMILIDLKQNKESSKIYKALSKN